MRAKRLLAWSLCGVFLAMLLISGVLLMAHLHHDCTHEDCPVCFAISCCRSLLRAFSALALLLGVLFHGSLVAHACQKTLANRVLSHTLISLKVKFTD